jgi:hypothetical protein
MEELRNAHKTAVAADFKYNPYMSLLGGLEKPRISPGWSVSRQSFEPGTSPRRSEELPLVSICSVSCLEQLRKTTMSYSYVRIRTRDLQVTQQYQQQHCDTFDSSSWNSRLRNVQTCLGIRPASYPKGTRVRFSGGKAAGA